jgi:hypothetical protein
MDRLDAVKFRHPRADERLQSGAVARLEVHGAQPLQPQGGVAQRALSFLQTLFERVGFGRRGRLLGRAPQIVGRGGQRGSVLGLDGDYVPAILKGVPADRRRDQTVMVGSNSDKLREGEVTWPEFFE